MKARSYLPKQYHRNRMAVLVAMIVVVIAVCLLRSTHGFIGRRSGAKRLAANTNPAGQPDFTDQFFLQIPNLLWTETEPAPIVNLGPDSSLSHVAEIPARPRLRRHERPKKPAAYVARFAAMGLPMEGFGTKESNAPEYWGATGRRFAQKPIVQPVGPSAIAMCDSGVDAFPTGVFDSFRDVGFDSSSHDHSPAADGLQSGITPSPILSNSIPWSTEYTSGDRTAVFGNFDPFTMLAWLPRDDVSDHEGKDRVSAIGDGGGLPFVITPENGLNGTSQVLASGGSQRRGPSNPGGGNPNPAVVAWEANSLSLLIAGVPPVALLFRARTAGKNKR